jgi:nicotinate-nucleotide pyrophosphorylase (carboxylating)
MLSRTYSHLLPPTYKQDVFQWLSEDVPNHDVGGFVVGDREETAKLLCKSSGVLAGVPFADAIIEHTNLSIEWYFEEGAYIDVDSQENKKVVVALVRGSVRNILLAERTMLNILARASGVATQAHRAVSIAHSYNWDGYVAGTRKTTPGFKMVEKYALVVGGATTHRMDLSHMVMLKDNHVWSVGSITNAVNKAKSVCGFASKVEVECQSVAEALEAASAGADIVMLDNFTASDLGSAAEEVKATFPNILIEASGVINRFIYA